MRAQRVVLEEMAERIRRRVEFARTEKIALGARYTAAVAATRAGESVTGLSDEMSGVARTVERARDKARDAQARSAALTELAGGPTAGGDYAVDESLIEARLAELKAAPLVLPE